MAANSKDENSSNKAKPVVDLGILEADDDFEEFPADGLYSLRGLNGPHRLRDWCMRG